MNSNHKYSAVTDKIIRAYYNVYNKLGFGFLEKVYEHALVIELRKLGLSTLAQQPVKVYYDNIEVGLYYADIIVENIVIVEIKAATALCPENEAQLINYLKATNMEVGLLINFGAKPEIRRRVYSSAEANHIKS